MEFCSFKCISDLQKSLGEFCTQCSSNVPFASLGKYSVRFGNDVKQFSLATCFDI